MTQGLGQLREHAIYANPHYNWLKHPDIGVISHSNMINMLQVESKYDETYV